MTNNEYIECILEFAVCIDKMKIPLGEVVEESIKRQR